MQWVGEDSSAFPEGNPIFSGALAGGGRLSHEGAGWIKKPLLKKPRNQARGQADGSGD
jgi:hypothetical protein